MKKTFAFLLISSVLFTSFTSRNENVSATDMVGVWTTGDPTRLQTFHMKVFEKDGDYYNVGFENGVTIMSHRGKYEIVNNTQYSEHVTELWHKAAWDLRGKSLLTSISLVKTKRNSF